MIKNILMATYIVAILFMVKNLLNLFRFKYNKYEYTLAIGLFTLVSILKYGTMFGVSILIASIIEAGLISAIIYPFTKIIIKGVKSWR